MSAESPVNELRGVVTLRKSRDDVASCRRNGVKSINLRAIKCIASPSRCQVPYPRAVALCAPQAMAIWKRRIRRTGCDREHRGAARVRVDRRRTLRPHAHRLRPRMRSMNKKPPQRRLPLDNTPASGGTVLILIIARLASRLTRHRSSCLILHGVHHHPAHQQTSKYSTRSDFASPLIRVASSMKAARR